MRKDFVLSFREDVRWELDPAANIIIQERGRKHTLSGAGGSLIPVLQQLSSTGTTEKQLSDFVIKKDGSSGLQNFYYWIRELEERGLICRSVVANGKQLATLRPSSPNYTPSDACASQDRRYKLSRFAYTHRLEDWMVVESPLSHSRIHIQSVVAAAILLNLTSFKTAQEICSISKDLNRKTTLLLLSLLLQAQLIYDDEVSEEKSETLLQWDFHDLLFHARSRLGRSDRSFGGTLRFKDKIEPLPAIKSFAGGEFISLFTPDLNKRLKEDPPFASVAESRKSERTYDEDYPITENQLGEFLYRVARIKQVVPSDKSRFSYEIATRPYPAGGACYELEIYVTIDRCDQIDPGFYYYEPQHHRLCKLSDPNEFTEALLSHARKSAGMTNSQVLITIAARFQRMSWKYESIAYAATLKHVGVLYQTMYLTAAAMNLAPCGIGTGDSDLFCRLARTDYYQETSVGEFLLGSKS